MCTLMVRTNVRSEDASLAADRATVKSVYGGLVALFVEFSKTNAHEREIRCVCAVPRPWPV